ncbi:MAG: outer membrane protein assembly factor BamD [Alphaproteobacteria bacterium]|nr:outer membrane protein assembly factor BamD [Alphaproteobacteria bacterium]
MKKIFLLGLIGVLMAACSDKDGEIIVQQPLNEIYDEAYDQFERGHYETAAEKFLSVETQYPASEWAPNALVMAAYSQYKDNDFAGAILIADRFMRFHPGHPDVPYILYLRGMCYYRQVSDVRREPGMSVYALQQFQQLVDRFPNSPYAQNAKNKIIILKNYIAGKIMYSARNDMRRKNWASAIVNLQSVISDAQETVMTAEAMYRLTQAYTAIGLPDQADGYAEMLKLNFPDSDWAKKLDK